MQRARRRDPYPFLWEVPLAIAVTVLLVMVVGVHLGRGLANVVVGAGWSLTAPEHLVTSLVAVLGGDAAAGLPPGEGPVASPLVLWAGIAVTEVVLVLVMVVLAKVGVDRWGPWRVRGMASPGEAERLLGLTRLRRVSGVVRPDLDGTAGRGRR